MSEVGPEQQGRNEPSEADQINALRTRIPLPKGELGWLSTLVWNVRNEYLMWPDGKIPAQTVQRIVEGFLTEIEMLKAAQSGRIVSKQVVEQALEAPPAEVRDV